MRLADLFPHFVLEDQVGDALVSRVEIDSRLCEPGVVFFAMPGTQDDGSRHVDDALQRGATLVVGVTGRVQPASNIVGVPEEKIFAELSQASYRIVGDPQRELQLVGVTGTNGKTSVTTFVTSLLRHLGRDAASIGTLTNARTTPAAPELARTLRAYLSEWQPAPVRPVVALEVSSHALTQHRVDGLRFDVSAFTNLSRDHLDYHHTMEEYFAAKARLFEGTRSRHAVIWNEGEWSEALLRTIDTPVTSVSQRSIANFAARIGQLSFTWREHEVTAPLTGAYNAANLVVAMEICVQLGEDSARVAQAASTLEPVTGRCEVVSTSGPAVIVDYAHTPEGLETVLRNIREVHQGRIITIFGCGGDRDQGKRPLMGAIAAALSDVVFITNDNPRSEEPTEIASQITSGIPDASIVHVVLDRREAIRDALEMAGVDDVVLIAGKGHEKTQTIGTTVLEFDDVLVARELMKEN